MLSVHIRWRVDDIDIEYKRAAGEALLYQALRADIGTKIEICLLNGFSSIFFENNLLLMGCGKNYENEDPPHRHQ